MQLKEKRRRNFFILNLSLEIDLARLDEVSLRSSRRQSNRERRRSEEGLQETGLAMASRCDVVCLVDRKRSFAIALDKNPDRVAEAQQRFLEVRAAYEVLSDPRERAWYDTHRDVMLKKGSGEDYEDDAINIYPFFTSSCYQGYNDSETVR